MQKVRATLCPRCQVRRLDPNGRNALSRADNKTYVCHQCGWEEAMEAVVNHNLR